MFTAPEAAEEEPPLSAFSPSPDCPSSACDCVADIMLAASPPSCQTHAVVIGRHTLAPLLALMRSGCESVTSHAPGTPPAGLDQVSLAWLSDLKSPDELNIAVHQLSHCLCPGGSMVLDATSMPEPTAVVVVIQCLAREGFRLRSVLRRGSHLILVAARRSAMALAA